MAKYMLAHTAIRNSEEIVTFWCKGSPQFGPWMAGGQPPACCIYACIPVALAEHREIYCLWDADDVEQVVPAAQQSGIEG